MAEWDWLTERAEGDLFPAFGPVAAFENAANRGMFTVDTVAGNQIAMSLGDLRESLNKRLQQVLILKRSPELTSGGGRDVSSRNVPPLGDGRDVSSRNDVRPSEPPAEPAQPTSTVVQNVIDRTADRVATLLAQKMETLPDFLRNSVTWDQGKEMAEHANFTVKTGVDVYFCDPHAPWQRGSNENTNGLLRQYFPKGTDLSGYTQAELDAVADELNNRPRETLGWLKPTEVLNKLLVEAGGAPTT